MTCVYWGNGFGPCGWRKDAPGRSGPGNRNQQECHRNVRTGRTGTLFDPVAGNRRFLPGFRRFPLGPQRQSFVPLQPSPEIGSPGADGNLKNFLTRKDLHWDQIPLAKKELRAVKELMEVVVRERSAHYEVNPDHIKKADRRNKRG